MFVTDTQELMHKNYSYNHSKSYYQSFHFHQHFHYIFQLIDQVFFCIYSFYDITIFITSHELSHSQLQ